MAINNQIIITTGARLHFGILSYEPVTGRHFGGGGLMIDSPGFQLLVKPGVIDEVSGPEECKKRCLEFLKTYRANAQQQPPPCRIEIRRTILSHVGLGSGTQFGLAIAKSLSLLAGENSVDTVELASRVGRGVRSALGIHGFQRGGFLLDGGKESADSIGTLEARENFPDEWRLLLVIPQDGCDGLSGKDEDEAFSRLPPMPQQLSARLRHISHKEMLPAVQNADFDRFSASVYEFGKSVGEFFASVQGGVYASPQTAELVHHLRTQGIHGIGQSSWGPTIFALLPNQQSADQLQAELSADSRWEGCCFHIARPMNAPAIIEAV
ncbi:MAG: beta-RFAP synthase [Planctomycetes bacterium]|nr:beta-RFAP synthase [Planctomycetota bacterium]